MYLHSKYHNSLYTYCAIALAVIAWFLSVASLSTIAFLTGLFAMIFVSFAMCCRLHRYFLLFTVFLSLVAMVGCFIGAARKEHEICQDGKCTDVPVKVFGSISGILWLVVAVLIYKIPLTDPNENRDNEMVGMHTSSGAQHDVA